MRDDHRRALEALRFNHVPNIDDVWAPAPFHVDGLHTDVIRRIKAGIAEAEENAHGCPVGIAMQGQRGSGKTHLLGTVRRLVQARDGYFFLVSLLDGAAFWESVVDSMRDGLSRRPAQQERQLTSFLKRLAGKAELPPSVYSAVVGESVLTPDALQSFVTGVRGLDPDVGQECQDTLRALILYGSTSDKMQDIGYDYLLSMNEAHPADRAKWGIKQVKRIPELIVRDISRLLALTGPAVIAVDQIDQLIAQSVKQGTGAGDSDNQSAGLLLDQIAGGLMDLRQVTRRTLTVVACLPNTWTMIRTHAVDTVADRFHPEVSLSRLPSPEFGQAIVVKRFAHYYASAEFEPAYPTWPIKPVAFQDAPDFTPRGLLKAVDRHVQNCFRIGHVLELKRLGDEDVQPAPAEPDPPASDSHLSELDERFAGLIKSVDVAAALAASTEDVHMPALLSAALAAWMVEADDRDRQYIQDPLPGTKPSLHARLRQVLDEHTEDETHWAFRAIASESPVAALNRLRSACTASGLNQGVQKRRLFLLRNLPWNKGPKTQEAIEEFSKAGGVTLSITEDDLRVFAALRQIQQDGHPDLVAWLLSRRPASQTALLREVFGEAAADDRHGEPSVSPGPTGLQAKPEPRPAAIGLGTRVDTREQVDVDLESLRKHAAIFAGSGSGKTVLIRRIVEECAVRGVSSIVLDPNNDLARLGDSWPEPPQSWAAGDAEAAAAYFANTEVVVWTPRREAGRPLAFQPLPDFRSVVDNSDELGAAIDAAVATLAPRAKVDGDLNKAVLGQAVLREALRFFARQGKSSLKDFISLLAELPEGVSALDKGEKIAGDMAQTLTAAMVNDPLFGGEGEPVDPGVLLTPTPGKKARVSVISFIGLPSESQRQSFVNQLQMGLFAWIKEHPAGAKPLGGLLVMDEAQTLAPSGAMTACTQSTLALASQARKYGLGLIFATQAPKGLHNRIVGNAATQLFGFLNSPAQIQAAREMAQAKGGTILDISRLKTGQFYVAAEGLGFEKVRTPLCLSYHPNSPLTPEEVIQRARNPREA